MLQMHMLLHMQTGSMLNISNQWQRHLLHNASPLPNTMQGPPPLPPLQARGAEGLSTQQRRAHPACPVAPVNTPLCIAQHHAGAPSTATTASARDRGAVHSAAQGPPSLPGGSGDNPPTARHHAGAPSTATTASARDRGAVHSAAQGPPSLPGGSGDNPPTARHHAGAPSTATTASARDRGAVHSAAQGPPSLPGGSREHPSMHSPAPCRGPFHCHHCKRAGQRGCPLSSAGPTQPARWLR